MFPERRVKLFKNGRNQAVRIPRGFELPGKDAVMRKEGDKLIVEAVYAEILAGSPCDAHAPRRRFPRDL